MFLIDDVHKKSLGNNERAATKATNIGSTTVEPKTKLLSKKKNLKALKIFKI